MSDKPEKIFVDLDGTLVRTDLFVEAILQFLRKNPLNIFPFILWLHRGIPYTKTRIAQHVDIAVEALPYEIPLLEYLKQEKQHGRSLILATAAHRIYADKVACYLGMFDAVLATDENRNLKGTKKLEAIREMAGNDTFAYAGDSKADTPIWAVASSGLYINAPTQAVAAAEVYGTAEKVIVSRPPLWRSFLRSMRPHRYIRNLLIFVPLFTSQDSSILSVVPTTLLAFLCFSLCASGVYFLIDLLNLPADRQHAGKRHQPLTSGDLPLYNGVAGAITLLALAFTLSSVLLPFAFTAVLAAYVFLAQACSFWLKHNAAAGVVAQAALWTVRIIAGAAAISTALPLWVPFFSVLAFTGLGFLGRYRSR